MCSFRTHPLSSMPLFRTSHHIPYFLFTRFLWLLSICDVYKTLNACLICARACVVIQKARSDGRPTWSTWTNGAGSASTSASHDITFPASRCLRALNTARHDDQTSAKRSLKKHVPALRALPGTHTRLLARSSGISYPRAHLRTRTPQGKATSPLFFFLFFQRPLLLRWNCAECAKRSRAAKRKAEMMPLSSQK